MNLRNYEVSIVWIRSRRYITINSIQFNFIEANQDGKWRNQCLESAMRENRDSTARDGP